MRQFLLTLTATAVVVLALFAGAGSAAKPGGVIGFQVDDGGGGCAVGSTWTVDVPGGNWTYRCRYACIAPRTVVQLDCWLV